MQVRDRVLVIILDGDVHIDVAAFGRQVTAPVSIAAIAASRSAANRGAGANGESTATDVWRTYAWVAGDLGIRFPPGLTVCDRQLEGDGCGLT